MILGLLADYTPEDPRERAYLDRMRDLAASPRCCARDHVDPGHFTASAFILSPDDADVLLIDHSKLHRWLQPGGHVDANDVSLEAAARREAEEETGLAQLELLAGPFDLDIHEIPARKTEPAHEHFDVRFLFRATSRDAVAGSDANAARWVPRADVPALKTDDSVWRAMHKLDRLVP